MKTKLNKIFAFLLIAFIGLSTFTASAANIPAGTKLYLKPNSNWVSSGARFAAYFCNGSATAVWVNMVDSNCDGVYEVTAPTGPHKNVIFCRMNPSSTTNGWTQDSQLWNQTSDLTWTSSNNTYTVKDGTWNKGGGTWTNVTYNFYVAGNGSGSWCDGKSWDKTGSKLDDNGVVTFNGVKQGTYEFKITNGTWDLTFGSGSLDTSNSTKGDCRFKDLGAGSDGNVKFTITEEANITIKYSGCKITINVAFDSPLKEASYVLMGVEGDWDNGIELEPNEKNTGEYMLLNQPITTSDAVKVVKVTSCGKDFYDSVNESPCSVKVTRDNDNNIKLPEGVYNFYFKDGKISIEPSVSSVKYVLMGVEGDWATGIELQENSGNADELMLLDQPISKDADAIKIVKKTPCGDEFYAAVSASTTVPHTGGGSGSAVPNIVLEDGTYNFFFNKKTGVIRIDGTLDDARIVYLDPVVHNADNPGTWTSDDARIALYAYQSKGTNNLWTTAIRCGEIYYAYLPLEYDMYIWVRIDPAKDANNWDNKWNQTAGIAYDAANQLTKLTGWADKDDKVHYQEPYKGTCGINYDDIECDFPELKGDTLFVTINKFVESDPCNYLFESFEQAFAVLKKNTEICDAQTVYYGSFKQDAITLRKPVVMQVVFGPEPYRGTEVVGMSGGHIGNAPAIFFRNINREGIVKDQEGNTIKGHELIVRTAEAKGNRAVIVHPVIRRSTNITLDNLDVISDTDLRDNAIDIDTGEGAENLEGLGGDFNVVQYSTISHNITLKNSKYISYGRNCIHVVGINGIHVENNEFYTKYDFSVDPTEGEDVVDWGGTIKFINTENVKFLRNNSEGTLATSFFIQGCRKVLLMNNVFWNDNAVSVPQLAERNRTVANVRLVNFGAKANDFKLQNIGIYYNTFFIKNNPSTELAGSYVKFDFFRLGGKEQPSNKDNFDPTTIRFQYNNCYSYDEDIKGNNDDETNSTTFYLQGIGKDSKWCQCFVYNNFWSKYDEKAEHTSSSFELGKYCTGENETYNLYSGVDDQVCKTDPEQPGALVVKGDSWNIGTVIVNDVSGQGADKIFNDRLNPDNGVNSIRPQMAVDNSNETLSPYDHIYKEPGTINLYTSPIVGSQTTDVHITSIQLSQKKDVNLSIVDKNDNLIWTEDDPIEDRRFAITNAVGDIISSLTTDANGSLDNEPVYITFVRPKGVIENKTYEAFLKVVPSQADDAQLLLRIPIRGHYRADINSIAGAWTVGAFQQREAAPVDTIIWHGLTSSEWDNRNNWYKTDGTLVTCLDALTDDLTVIIPKKNSEKYRTPAQGVVQYPKLPKLSSEEEFKTKRDAKWHGEQVNAGNSGQVANKIFMEYGAALVGVERLGSKRYSEAEMEFIARRREWLLVGPVVRPWELDEDGNQIMENKKPKARDVVSRDYYLNHFPHVYMHRAEVKWDADAIKASWNTTFADLDSVLNNEKAFAIRIPDEYGDNLEWFGVKTEKLPAALYNMYFCGGEQVYDGEAPHTYTFKGRFYNESSLPTYTIKKPGIPVILNNSYPANIDAQQLQQGLGSEAYPVQYYNYETKGFNAIGDDEKSIMSQHSFIIVPKEGIETLVIDTAWFQTTETGHRSVSENIESFRIELRNKATSSASEIYVRYDALKDDEENNSLDAPKIFNTMETSLPDLYTIRYNKMWAGLVIPTISEPIPLGINVGKANQKFTFSLKKSTLPADVILEDRKTERQYNLSAGERCYVDDLEKGTCEGRFYLMLQEREVELPEDDDVTTEVEDNQTSNGGIDVFTQGKSVVVSASSDIELEQVIISDMTGRHQVYNVSGQYVQMNLPVNTGVYTISVIGDKQTRVEKIKLN